MRKCPICGVSKPLDDFYAKRPCYCIPCARQKARDYYHANREVQAAKAIERGKRERRGNPERARAREREYWARPENKARKKVMYARADALRRKDPKTREQRRKNWQRWRDANAEHERARLRAVQADRLARKLNQFVEHVEPLVVLERGDGVCGICGHDVDPLAFHVDHIIPLSRGGAHSYANTQPAHPFCNASKGARLPEELERVAAARAATSPGSQPRSSAHPAGPSPCSPPCG